MISCVELPRSISRVRVIERTATNTINNGDGLQKVISDARNPKISPATATTICIIGVGVLSSTSTVPLTTVPFTTVLLRTMTGVSISCTAQLVWRTGKSDKRADANMLHWWVEDKLRVREVCVFLRTV